MINSGKDMNYKKIYNQIIDRAKNRTLDGYGEKHHIVPKCMNGTNHPDNLVKLTAREHFLAHWLLHEMYPNNADLRYAFWSMCRNSDNQKRYVPSSRIYGYAKEQMLEVWQKFKPSESQVDSVKKRLTGTKWYHKIDGTNLRTFPTDPILQSEEWVKGRFNGKVISNNANKEKENKYLGKKRPATSNRKCSIDGVEFESAKAAADFHNVNEYTMRDRLTRQPNGKFKNWFYIE
jgi:hypothetical protein